eukprot:CAMPEP_0179436726 /NCGR_PEP_ID=MMETSP0799-20121207/20693_1 /TAXON_ID=46947 /ORGANISM="Geminigera cryophila, Strain CCMP2564" /LENGTH=92 /DNA_ID=CAMNT_0021217099 /DNA_START=546 /DNA_END=824 /DNA_ORIENTATION=+
MAHSYVIIAGVNDPIKCDTCPMTHSYVTPSPCDSSTCAMVHSYVTIAVIYDSFTYDTCPMIDSYATLLPRDLLACGRSGSRMTQVLSSLKCQ